MSGKAVVRNRFRNENNPIKSIVVRDRRYDKCHVLVANPDSILGRRQRKDIPDDKSTGVEYAM